MKTITRAEFSKLSSSDLLVELSRRGLKMEDVSVLKKYADCPKCGHHGRVDKDFGVRVMRGEVWPQSWCKECRAKGTSSKGKTKHKN